MRQWRRRAVVHVDALPGCHRGWCGPRDSGRGGQEVCVCGDAVADAAEEVLVAAVDGRAQHRGPTRRCSRAVHGAAGLVLVALDAAVADEGAEDQGVGDGR